MFGFRGFGNNNQLYSLLNRFNQFTAKDFFSGLSKKHHASNSNDKTIAGRLFNQPLQKNRFYTEPLRIPDIIAISQLSPAEDNFQTYDPARLNNTSDSLLNQEPPSSNQPMAENTYYEKNFLNLVELNLNFSLADFEKTISSLIEDAQDGEFETANYTNTNVGLSVDFNAKARLVETYSVDKETSTPQATEWLKVKAMSETTMAAIMKTRASESEMFYRESLKSSYSENKVYSDGFIRVSRKLAMKYNQDMSFSFKSLNLYNTQAEQLEESGDVEGYVQQTEALVDNPDSTGELIGQFFEAVQGYLDKSENDIIEKVNTFFNNLAEQMGVESSYLDQSRESLLNEISVFFDNVDQAMGSLSDKYIEPGNPVEEIPEPPIAEEIPEDTGDNVPVLGSQV